MPAARRRCVCGSGEWCAALPLHVMNGQACAPAAYRPARARSRCRAAVRGICQPAAHAAPDRDGRRGLGRRDRGSPDPWAGCTSEPTDATASSSDGTTGVDAACAFGGRGAAAAGYRRVVEAPRRWPCVLVACTVRRRAGGPDAGGINSRRLGTAGEQLAGRRVDGGRHAGAEQVVGLVAVSGRRCHVRASSGQSGLPGRRRRCSRQRRSPPGTGRWPQIADALLDAPPVPDRRRRWSRRRLLEDQVRPITLVEGPVAFGGGRWSGAR